MNEGMMHFFVLFITQCIVQIRDNIIYYINNNKVKRANACASAHDYKDLHSPQNFRKNYGIYKILYQLNGIKIKESCYAFFLLTMILAILVLE